MPRVTKKQEEQAAVPVIHRNAVYDLDQARNTLRLAKATLGREIRLGRLRVAKRAGRYLILGKWLLEWIIAGEVGRDKKTPARVTDTVEQFPSNGERTEDA
jgi:hypothetical protein